MSFFFQPEKQGDRAGFKETRRLARQADQEVRETREEVRALRGQVDRLYSITEAMWFVMKEKLGVPEEELGELAQDIDRRIRSFEGRSLGSCPHCSRPLSARTGACIYCVPEEE